jgi:chromosome partitioning protein
MTHPIHQPILEGNLADFNLVEVLQVLSLSRQYTRVELFVSEDNFLAGSVFIKSGKVVQASNGGLRGKKAFMNLIHQPRGRFRVFRINTPALIPEPIGSLSHLLIEALEADRPPVARKAPARAAFANANASASARKSVSQAPRSVAPAKQLPPLPRPAAVRQRMTSGVRAMNLARGPHIIAIASPKGGSGKTTVALNLALSLARREHRVILVDGDVNGDVMSSIDGRGSAKAGVFDVLTGGASPLDALRKTIVQDLEILPAIGQSLPRPEIAFEDYRDRWQLLLRELAERAEIVIVDTPSGMLGITYQILSACTHVVGVLQAEIIAQRSFSMFGDCLSLLPESNRPTVLGVFLNMLQLRHPTSIGVLVRACEKLPKGWLFETSIPRSSAFLDAAEAGVPVHMYDPKHPPAVSWLFDTLAGEVMERLALEANELQVGQRRFLA